MRAKRLKIDESQIRQLRQSAGVHQFTREVAERVAAAAGPGFAVKEQPSRNRPRFIVVPVTREAHRANAKYLAAVAALGKV